MKWLGDDKPQLSIVSITRNDPVGLRRTILSGTNWRENGVEWLVVDGSDCDSAWRGEDKGFQVIRRVPLGIADAMNTGLQGVRGEWVWFVNGGDAICEELDANWLRFLLQRTRADVVIGGIVYDESGEMNPVPGIGRRWPLVCSWIPHPATIVRRRSLVDAGGFDRSWRIAMDWELWHRLIRPETIVDFVSVPFVRFAAGGVSQRSEMMGTVRSEGALVLRRHWRALVCEGTKILGQTCRALWKAWWTTRLEKGVKT